MKRDYLGDSYDCVKRLWQEVLADWAPLYAETRFIPEDLQVEFTRLTAIPILDRAPSSSYSILNDPDTGIRLPGKGNQAESRTHIALPSVCDQVRQCGVRAVVTFDQSNYRFSGLTLAEQREAKMRYLTQAGLFAFYYVSHAPFLFVCPDGNTGQCLRQRLLSFGVPNHRFELISE